MERLAIVLSCLCLALAQNVTRPEATADTTPMATRAPETMAPTMKPTMMPNMTMAPTTMKPTMQPNMTMAPTTMAPTMQPNMTMAPTTMAPTSRPIPTSAPSMMPTRAVVDMNMTTGMMMTTPGEECGARADIIFVVDSSSSVEEGNFNKTLDFLKTVVTDFTVGPDDVQFAVIQYSGSPVTQFTLNEHNTSMGVIANIGKMVYSGGSTATGDAIGAMIKLFDPKFGDRSNAANIGIVITDGQSGDTQKNSELAKKAGIKMFAIGVGGGVVQSELQQIASGPDFVFNITNYDSLESIKKQLTSKTCNVASKEVPTTTTPAPTTTTEAPTTTTEAPTTTPDCRREAADIYFALDSSGSIGVPSYEDLKSFVSDIVDTLNVASDAVRIGLIRYSNSVTASFHLNTYFDKAFMKDSIQRLPYDGTGTKTDSALEYLRTTGFTGNRGARANTPKLAIIVTDGQSTYPRATGYQAQLLKQTGVRIFVIGVGDKVDINEMETIATSPNYVFRVKDYKALTEIQGSLETLTCQAILEPLPNAKTTTSTTTKEQGCGDKSDQCAVYGKSVCSDYEPWARDNCGCYCGFCPCTTTGGPCFDRLSNCEDYQKDLCFDPAYRAWVIQNCAAHCGICKTPAPTQPMTTTTTPNIPSTPFNTPELCRDAIPNCADYGTAPCTDPLFATFVNTKCRRYCKIC